MQWNDSYSELVTCFTNTIKNRDGGTHLTGFRQALTRTINNYANEYKLLKEAKSGLHGITLGAKNLYELIANAPGEEVTVKKADNHWAEIKSGKVTYRIVAVSPRETVAVAVNRELLDGNTMIRWRSPSTA
jgi:hypothetical protein